MSKAKWMTILWPAFLAAGVLEVLVFGLIDPNDLHWQDAALPLSRQGVYTLAFVVFWLVAAASSAITAVLGMSAEDVNR